MSRQLLGQTATRVKKRNQAVCVCIVVTVKVLNILAGHNAAVATKVS